MGWKGVAVMDQRVRFIAEYLRDYFPFNELCDGFNISRKTGYKWVERYEQGGPEGLADNMLTTELLRFVEALRFGISEKIAKLEALRGSQVGDALAFKVQAYPIETEYHISVEADFRTVYKDNLNRIVFTSCNQGDFPNKEILATSLKLIESMKENNNDVIYFSENGEVVIPVVDKAGEKYKLAIGKNEAKNILVYKDLFGK